MRQRGALPHADELRVRAVAVDAEDLVTDRELGDGRADCLDHAGKLGAEDLPPWSAEAGDEAADEIFGAAKAGVGPGDRRGVDLDQDFVVLGYGTLDLFKSQNLWRAVPFVDDCSHRAHVLSSARWRR